MNVRRAVVGFAVHLAWFVMMKMNERQCAPKHIKKTILRAAAAVYSSVYIAERKKECSCAQHKIHPTCTQQQPKNMYSSTRPAQKR